jgi:hypothetical protein
LRSKKPQQMAEEILEKARRMSTTGKRKVFNSLLKRALKRKGISVTMLAERLGVPAGTVQHWFYGVHLPPSKYGGPLGDALDNSTLEAWLDTLYTHYCAVCKGIFRSEGFSGPRKYCGDDCRRMANKVGAKNIAAKPSRDRDLLVIYKRSVAAFCHECARSPICPNAKCELRAASPLKTEEDIELMRPVRRSTKWTEERKQAFSKKMKEQWADPEIKERRVAAVRKGVADMGEQGREQRRLKVKFHWAQRTPEQMQAHIEKTSATLQKGREEYQAKQAAAKE